MRLGKYELGRTLGEGNFGKVKFAKRVDTGEQFAVKILDRNRILQLKIHDQIKREISTLKLLKHPNVVRLHEISASKTRIYMVLEYVNGGELFDKIVKHGRLSEQVGRKIFQQLIDGISYCHDKGVYHRDLKPENILIDANGKIKISDFGLSALSQHLWNDGLLHTTCGSPNYIAPEVLANRGYDGAMSDIWSCGVILYIILVGELPFEDRNLAVLYQKIIKGDTQIPEFLSVGAQNILRRILDPNPTTRINVAQIKEHVWFKQDYIMSIPYDDDTYLDDEFLSLNMSNEIDECKNNIPIQINAFELIGMSSCLDLSGFFEKEDVSKRKIRFTTNYTPRYLFQKIGEIITEMGFQVQSRNQKLKLMRKSIVFTTSSSLGTLSLVVEVFELSPSLYVVELRKAYGDLSLYRKLSSKISDDLALYKSEPLFKIQSILPVHSA